jgi:hypothetical protein
MLCFHGNAYHVHIVVSNNKNASTTDRKDFLALPRKHNNAKAPNIYVIIGCSELLIHYAVTHKNIYDI